MLCHLWVEMGELLGSLGHAHSLGNLFSAPPPFPGTHPTLPDTALLFPQVLSLSQREELLAVQMSWCC